MTDQDKQFAAIDEHLAAGFAAVDERFVTALAAVDEHFAEQRQYVEYGFDTLRSQFQGLNRRFDRIEETLLRFIDTQGGLNRDFDGRVRTLERTRRPRKQ